MQSREAGPFNHNEMLERLGGDAELLADVIGVFLEECPRALEKIETAMTSADAAGLRRAAHSLKGALLNISASPAATEAKQLEILGNEERLAEAPAVHGRLQQEIERLNKVLQELLER